jgi:hypothetical protein
MYNIIYLHSFTPHLPRQTFVTVSSVAAAATAVHGWTPHIGQPILEHYRGTQIPSSDGLVKKYLQSDGAQVACAGHRGASSLTPGLTASAQQPGHMGSPSSEVTGENGGLLSRRQSANERWSGDHLQRVCKPTQRNIMRAAMFDR